MCIDFGDTTTFTRHFYATGMAYVHVYTGPWTYNSYVGLIKNI